MNQKIIGIILLIVGIVLGIVTASEYNTDKEAVDQLLMEDGTCFLEDGTCLHSELNTTTLLFSIIVISLLVLGVYLTLFDKSQKLILEQSKQVSEALEKANNEEVSKAAFDSYLTAFAEEDQKIIKVLKENEGITQSTLRFKTGLSKTRLSLLLASLETRGVVYRTVKGKSKQVFLTKSF
jgi:uncharacterized membrane protein